MKDISIRIYHFLLRFYPARFRREFEEQMLLDFSDMAADADKNGTRSLVFFYLRELIDFPVSLLKAYLSRGSTMPSFRPGAGRNILRIAFAFGITLALNTFAGLIAFIDQAYLPTIWRLWHFLGWQGTYQDIQSVLLNFSELILGPVLAAIILLIVFPEMRPIKRYLPAITLAFALPAMLVNLRATIFKNPDFTFEDTVFALAGYILVGVGLGVVAGLISQQRRKILWLLAAGPLGLFFTSWGLNVLVLRLQIGHSAAFWSGVTSVAMRNFLVGMIVGLLLGVVIEFKKQYHSPPPLSTT